MKVQVEIELSERDLKTIKSYAGWEGAEVDYIKSAVRAYLDEDQHYDEWRRSMPDPSLPALKRKGGAA